ncbi:MAG: flagellar protein FliS [Pseudomonadota bacterium]
MNFAAMYRNVGNETRADLNDQHQLVAVMFDGLIEALQKARGAMALSQTIAKVHAINQSIRILEEGLLVNLDLERGGDLAQNLASLYEYAIHQLTIANVRNDADIIEAVIELIRPLGDAWKQIAGHSDFSKSAEISAIPNASFLVGGARMGLRLNEQMVVYGG